MLSDVNAMNEKLLKIEKAKPVVVSPKKRKVYVKITCKQKELLLTRVLYLAELFSTKNLFLEKVEGKFNVLHSNDYLSYNEVLVSRALWSKVKIGGFPVKLLKKEFVKMVPNKEVYTTLCVRETEIYCYCRDVSRGEKLIGKKVKSV